MSGEGAADGTAFVAGRLLLPAVKISVANGAKQLEKRFNYLWQTAHASISTNAPVAHQMIASMMQIARVNRAVLSAEVLDYVCEHCGGLLVPTVSADVRVVPSAPKAAANRKLALQRRRAKRVAAAPVAPEVLTSAVRVTCRRCQHANLRAGVTVLNKSKTKKDKGKKRAIDEAGADDRTQDGLECDGPAPKRTKIANDNAKQGGGAASITPAELAKPAPKSASLSKQYAQIQQQAQPSVLMSLVDPPPPSPPRKLLDGPKRKKKKKTVAVDAAAAAAKSSLNSFLQSLRPGTSK